MHTSFLLEPAAIAQTSPEKPVENVQASIDRLARAINRPLLKSDEILNLYDCYTANDSHPSEAFPDASRSDDLSPDTRHCDLAITVLRDSVRLQAKWFDYVPFHIDPHTDRAIDASWSPVATGQFTVLIDGGQLSVADFYSVADSGGYSLVDKLALKGSNPADTGGTLFLSVVTGDRISSAVKQAIFPLGKFLASKRVDEEIARTAQLQDKSKENRDRTEERLAAIKKALGL